MSDTKPLENKDNWTQEKTWIIPLKITVLVDDATKYDDVMEAFVKNFLNELRNIASTLDKRGCKINFGQPITNPDDANAVFKAAKGEIVSKANLQSIVADLVKQEKEKK